MAVPSMTGPPVRLAQCKDVGPQNVSPDSGLGGPRNGGQSLASLRWCGYPNGGSSDGTVRLSQLATAFPLEGLSNCMRERGSLSQQEGVKSQLFTDRRKESAVMSGENNYPPIWNATTNAYGSGVGWLISSKRLRGEGDSGAQYLNIWQQTEKDKFYHCRVTAKTSYNGGLIRHNKTLSLLGFSGAPYSGLVTSANSGSSTVNDMVDKYLQLYSGNSQSVVLSLEVGEFVNSTSPSTTQTLVTRCDLKATQ